MSTASSALSPKASEKSKVTSGASQVPVAAKSRAGKSRAKPRTSKGKDAAVEKERVKGAPHGDVPRCAKEVVTILNAMGITDYDHKVVPQLLEFCYKYVSDVLEDATRYGEHRTRGNVEVKLTKDDLKLAVQARVDFSCSGPPPREFLLETARKKNDEPLPLIAEDKFGVRLPVERFQLTNRNYRVLPQKMKSSGTNQGPWALPHTVSAVEAAKRAKAERQRRRLKEDLDHRKPSAPATQVVVAAKAADGSDDDDYDA
eukprot:m.113952 g.113952  ORF g.113952 m.113952 type:complete len:258 (-) comp28312_c1_seq1:50-823(-)